MESVCIVAGPPAVVIITAIVGMAGKAPGSNAMIVSSLKHLNRRHSTRKHISCFIRSVSVKKQASHRVKEL